MNISGVCLIVIINNQWKCFLIYLHLSQTDKRLASSHFSGWRRWWVCWGTVVRTQWTRCESVSTSLIAALTPEWTACLRWSAWPQSIYWFQRIQELLLLVQSLHKLKIQENLWYNLYALSVLNGIYISIEIAIYKYDYFCIPFSCSLNIFSVSKSASSLFFSSAWIWTHPLPTEVSIFLNLYSMALHSLEESSISLWMIKPEEKKYPMLRC